MPSFFSRAAAPAAPLICTGDQTLVRLQLDGYRAAFEQLVRTEVVPNGFRWIFRAEPGLTDRLRTLAEREAECCRFLSFDLGTDGDLIIWEITAEASAAAVLAEVGRLPQRLRDEPRPEHDIVALERHAEEAGLRFTAIPGAGERD
jgi:hypothetical protein